MIENTKNTKIPETNDDIEQQIGDVEQRTPGRLRLAEECFLSITTDW